MFTRALTIAALAACTSTTNAQPVVNVEGIFGLPSFPAADLYRVDADGTTTPYTLDTPNFFAFAGLAWDQSSQRVFFNASSIVQNRIVSIDADFDPASLNELVGGLANDTEILVDVDPATGTVYWNRSDTGEIVSVQPGSGLAPQVVASGLPLIIQLNIDAQRGRYLAMPTEQTSLLTGTLDGSATPTTIDPLTVQAEIGGATIDRITGDFLWTETGGDSTALVADVVRTPADLTDIRSVFSIISTSAFDLTIFHGIDAADDTIVVSEELLPNTAFRLREINAADGTSSILVDNLLTKFDEIELRYTIDLISQQPESVLVDAGTAATLTVATTDPTAVFRWRRNGQPLSDDARISGATTDTLTISPAQLTDTDAYTCRVTNPAGDEQISDVAVVSVRGELPPPECPADQNFDGSLSPADFNAWILNYNTGCP